MRWIAVLLYYSIYFVRGCINRFLSFFYKKMLRGCGSNVRFSALTSDFTYRIVTIGNDVYFCFSSYTSFLAYRYYIVIYSCCFYISLLEKLL